MKISFTKFYFIGLSKIATITQIHKNYFYLCIFLFFPYFCIINSIYTHAVFLLHFTIRTVSSKPPLRFSKILFSRKPNSSFLFLLIVFACVLFFFSLAFCLFIEWVKCAFEWSLKESKNWSVRCIFEFLSLDFVLEVLIFLFVLYVLISFWVAWFDLHCIFLIFFS